MREQPQKKRKNLPKKRILLILPENSVLMALLIFKCSVEQKVQNEVQYSINCLAVIVIFGRLCLTIQIEPEPSSLLEVCAYEGNADDCNSVITVQCWLVYYIGFCCLSLTCRCVPNVFIGYYVESLP